MRSNKLRGLISSQSLTSKKKSSEGFVNPLGMSRMMQYRDIDQARLEAAQDPYRRWNIPENQREDYQLNPVMRSVHGYPITEQVPELKKPIPIGDFKTFSSGRIAGGTIRQAIQEMIGSKNIQSEMNPLSFSSHNNLMGNIALNIRSMLGSKNAVEFAGWKSRVNRAFAEYLTFTTGAQRGYPEIQFLKPNFPQTHDPPAQFINTSLSALEDVNRNNEMFLENEKAQGYRTRELRELSPVSNPEEIRSQAIRSGIDLPTAYTKTQYQLGQEITSGSKRYRITGLSNPNDPDIEEIQ